MTTTRGPAVACLVMAVLAWAGAVGLAVGGIDLGADVEDRLPGHSPVLAAVALGVVVAVPMTWAGLRGTGPGREPGDRVALAAVLLVGWICVQLVLIRTFHPLQVVCIAYGLALLVWTRVPAVRRHEPAPDRSRPGLS